MTVTSIRNETPSRLTLNSIDGTHMVLVPLQELAIEEDSGFFFDDLEREGLVSQRQDTPSSVGDNLITAVVGGGFWIVILCAIFAKTEPKLGLSANTWPYAVWVAGILLLASVVAGLIIRSTNSLTVVARWTMQTVSLTVILAIGVGLPAATIYYFGEGRTLLAAPSLALFGRLLQLTMIATASLLPVLLFFLFDRYQVNTLRTRLYANLFRLDRSLTSIREIDAKYGSQIREAYGSDERGRSRLTPGTRWPVLVCSFVTTIGWIVALAPVGSGFRPQTTAELLGALAPQRSALVFGFLGVYFFSLRMIARRYARGDLKPKAYTNIIVRMFIVAVLSWVLEAMFTGTPGIMLTLAFLFGIAPDEFFTWLREFTRGVVPEKIIPSQTLPLTDLEGIDIYDLSRLENEGVVNIEAFAHHELIDLIIETRVPVTRLVDWMDQAILYLHLVGGPDGNARTTLRNYGIRTASDLLRAWDEAAKRDKELEAFKALLGGKEAPYRLQVIRDALLDDEWIGAIISWRKDESWPEVTRDAVPTTVDSLNERADQEMGARRYARALSLLDKALQIQDTAGTRLRLARILATSPVVSQRDPTLAAAHAALAYQLAPDDYAGLIDLIEIYLALDDAANAALMAERARAIVEGWPSSMQKQKDAERKRLEKLVKPAAVAA